MKRLNRYILTLISTSLLAVSCSDFLTEQTVDGLYSSDIVWDSPSLAEGVLLKGYQLLNSEYFNVTHDKDDYGTSDMVTNVTTDAYISLATGGWTSSITQLSFYDKSYQAIFHINDFLQHVDQVDFAPQSDQTVKDQYTKRLTGEAHALRAWWYYQLLRAHSGQTASGELMGFPIVTEAVVGEDAMIPRSTFKECADFIIEDCDKAIEALPAMWTSSDRVEGSTNTNRINGSVARVIKSRVMLLGASEAFAESGFTFAQSAEVSADLMDLNNGISALDPDELHFYDLEYDITSCTSVFWYSSVLTNTTRETSFYAPSLYGSAKINPSQNLVDCFPAANGYPITMSESEYDASTPYTNRDPRLATYIYCDGDQMHGSTTLNISSGDDAPGAKTTSSRTGYYLRKLLNEVTDLTSGSTTKGVKYRVFSRYTEVLLNFAEAANEAVGPTTEIGGYTAQAVVNALRARAGITDESYVNSLDQDGFREFIRNERRIELCFESFRFWDMRRWNDLEAMNETVKGITESEDGVYTIVNNIESRSYQDYMIYGPIPYSETLKYDLVQNKGWD